MSKISFFPTVVLAAVISISSVSTSTAGFPLPPGFPAPPGVNVQVNGYLPSPPGVHIRMDAGRPYYVERERRIYVERDPKHYKKRHYKNKHYRNKHRDDHDNRGRGNGHGR